MDVKSSRRILFGAGFFFEPKLHLGITLYTACCSVIFDDEGGFLLYIVEEIYRVMLCMNVMLIL